MKKLGIYIIGTNGYFPLAIRFIKKFQYFYKGSCELEFILFSDTDPEMYLPTFIDYKFFETKHDCWLDGTNSKFKNILDNSKKIDVDYLYYFDADTDIHKTFDDWFIGDIVAGEHCGYSSHGRNSDLNNDSNIYTLPFDRNPASSCFLDKPDSESVYCYGAFFGGRYSKVLDMLFSLNEMMILNNSNNHEPPWNDESYLNYYFNTEQVKIIPSINFQFLISCKAGMVNIRDTNLNIKNLKLQMEKHRDYVFNISNGETIIPLFLMKKAPTIDIDHCYYINPDDYSFRKPHIEKVVQKLNFENSYRISKNSESNSKINNITTSHIEVLTQIISNDHFPSLILEDDCEYIDINIELPSVELSDIDAIYLGGSLYPHGGGVYLEEYDKYYYRVYNMLSTHAILILNKSSAELIKKIYELALSKNDHLDLYLAEYSNRLKFLTPKSGPFFYQNDDLTRSVTMFKWCDNLNLLKTENV
jgi:hypothetical protein